MSLLEMAPPTGSDKLKSLGDSLDSLENIQLPRARPNLHLQSAPTVRQATLDFVTKDSPLSRAIDATGAKETLSVITGNTGSSGNMTCLIGTGRAGKTELIAIDGGLSRPKLREMFNAHGLQLALSDLSAESLADLKAPGTTRSCWWNHLLITHLHTDHFNETVAQTCIQYGITVHIPPGSREAFLKNDPPLISHRRILNALQELERAGLLQEFAPGTRKMLGEFEVTCERGQHDIPANTYLVNYGSLGVFHTGDTGSYTSRMLNCAARAHAVLGDGNYSAALIDQAQRPEAVLERTKSLTGHMGNHQNGDVLEWISEGAFSHTLQLAVYLHRSSATNYPDKRSIVKDLIPRWNAEVAGRHCPALVVAEPGPQFLFSLGSNRTLVLPHDRAPNKLLKVEFGETGLSFALGRDVMPELTKEHRERSDEIHRVISAPDLRERVRNMEAEIIWRVPGQMAVVQSSGAEKCEGIANVLFNYDPRNRAVKITLSPDFIKNRCQGDLGGLVRELNDYLGRRLGTDRGVPRLVASGDSILSRVEIAPEQIAGMTTLIEYKLFGGVNRLQTDLKKSSVRWIDPQRLAVVDTADVLFPHRKLADVVVLYRREAQRLRIECADPQIAAEFLSEIRVKQFLAALKSEVFTGKDLAWVQEPLQAGSRLKHSGPVELTRAQLSKVAELALKHLLWGDES